MNRLGHAGLSLGLYAPIAFILIGVNQYLLTVVGLFGVLAATNSPDVDTHLPFLTHRRQTHTVWFAIFAPLLTAAALLAFSIALPAVHLFIPSYGWFTLFVSGMVCLGVCSHLLGDLFTPHGIRPFRPLSDQKFTLNIFRSASTKANGVAFFGGMVLLWGGILLGTSL